MNKDMIIGSGDNLLIQQFVLHVTLILSTFFIKVPSDGLYTHASTLHNGIAPLYVAMNG